MKRADQLKGRGKPMTLLRKRPDFARTLSTLKRRASPLAKADHNDEHVVRVEIDGTGGKGLLKDLGGAQDDRWNERLVSQLGAALPGYHGADAQVQSQLTTAVAVGLIDFKPKDAVEAMLGTQMIAANTAALDLYRRAWVPEQNFEVRSKYLALADKAARTVAVLSDALDKRRGRGQQQITVRHVTVNAEQAVVADTIINGRQEGAGDERENQSNPLHWPMHQARRCSARSKRSGKPCRSPAVRGHRVCRMHGARGGAPKGKANGNYKTGRFTAEVTQASRYVRALARLLTKLDDAEG